MTKGKLISIERVAEIMKSNGIEYTSEELVIVRDFLIRLYEISAAHYERVQNTKAKIIQINSEEHYEKKSIPLCQSEHRRAS